MEGCGCQSGFRKVYAHTCSALSCERMGDVGSMDCLQAEKRLRQEHNQVRLEAVGICDLSFCKFRVHASIVENVAEKHLDIGHRGECMSTSTSPSSTFYLVVHLQNTTNFFVHEASCAHTRNHPPTHE